MERHQPYLYDGLSETGCVEFGDFKLKSGIMSPVYCDLRKLISNPALLADIGRRLGEKAKGIGCDRIAGIPYGGIPIAVAASIASGIPMIYPRKEIKDHGTKQSIEGAYKEGEKVLVIDDLITSGESFGEAIEPLLEAGLVVKDLLVVLDREQGGAQVIAKSGYNVYHLITLPGLVNGLAAQGKIDEDMRARVEKYLAENQFTISAN